MLVLVSLSLSVSISDTSVHFATSHRISDNIILPFMTRSPSSALSCCFLSTVHLHFSFPVRVLLNLSMKFILK